MFASYQQGNKYENNNMYNLLGNNLYSENLNQKYSNDVIEGFFDEPGGACIAAAPGVTDAMCSGAQSRAACTGHAPGDPHNHAPGVCKWQQSGTAPPSPAPAPPSNPSPSQPAHDIGCCDAKTKDYNDRTTCKNRIQGYTGDSKNYQTKCEANTGDGVECIYRPGQACQGGYDPGTDPGKNPNNPKQSVTGGQAPACHIHGDITDPNGGNACFYYNPTKPDDKSDKGWYSIDMTAATNGTGGDPVYHAVCPNGEQTHTQLSFSAANQKAPTKCTSFTVPDDCYFWNKKWWKKDANVQKFPDGTGQQEGPVCGMPTDAGCYPCSYSWNSDAPKSVDVNDQSKFPIWWAGIPPPSMVRGAGGCGYRSSAQKGAAGSNSGAYVSNVCNATCYKWNDKWWRGAAPAHGGDSNAGKCEFKNPKNSNTAAVLLANSLPKGSDPVKTIFPNSQMNAKGWDCGQSEPCNNCLPCGTEPDNIDNASRLPPDGSPQTVTYDLNQYDTSVTANPKAQYDVTVSNSGTSTGPGPTPSTPSPSPATPSPATPSPATPSPATPSPATPSPKQRKCAPDTTQLTCNSGTLSSPYDPDTIFDIQGCCMNTELNAQKSQTSCFLGGDNDDGLSKKDFLNMWGQLQKAKNSGNPGDLQRIAKGFCTPKQTNDCCKWIPRNDDPGGKGKKCGQMGSGHGSQYADAKSCMVVEQPNNSCQADGQCQGQRYCKSNYCVGDNNCSKCFIQENSARSCSRNGDCQGDRYCSKSLCAGKAKCDYLASILQVTPDADGTFKLKKNNIPDGVSGDKLVKCFVQECEGSKCNVDADCTGNRKCSGGTENGNMSGYCNGNSGCPKCDIDEQINGSKCNTSANCQGWRTCSGGGGANSNDWSGWCQGPQMGGCVAGTGTNTSTM